MRRLARVGRGPHFPYYRYLNLARVCDLALYLLRYLVREERALLVVYLRAFDDNPDLAARLYSVALLDAAEGARDAFYVVDALDVGS